MHYVFVYGTLKKGGSNHRKYLSGASFKGNMMLNYLKLYRLGDSSLAIPGCRETEDQDSWVSGELYGVLDKDMWSLDSLEGHPYLYTRTTVGEINLGNKLIVPVEVYIYKGDVRESLLLKSGKYDLPTAVVL